jgi:tetratricopeptide (TPR) repeat protein
MTWLALVVVLAVQPAFDSPGDAFHRAEQQYQEQNYQGAIETYDAIRALGVEDGALYYNLGNAYFKAGHLGRAILNYERALRLMPGDEDARANLAFANELLSDSVEPLPLPLVIGWVVDLYQRLRPGLLAEILSLAFLIGGAATTFLLLDRWPSLRTAAVSALVTAVVLAVVSGASLTAKLYSATHLIEAIVVTENAYVRSGPGESSPRLAEIHEGLKVRLLGEREGFAQVSLANGLTGWIPKDQLEAI